MTKRQLLNKFGKILCDRSIFISDYKNPNSMVFYIGQKRKIKALTKDFILLDDNLYMGYLNVSLKQLINLFDTVLNDYINSLTYGNMVLYPVRVLKNVGGIIYTSTLNDAKIQKCIIERYWTNDKHLNDAYKIKLVPINQNYETVSLYLSDFKTNIKLYIK
jgi:hypothetical protein